MALDLSLMQTRLRLCCRAYSKAYRMMRSTPLRELTSSWTAISSAVPFLKKPPTPTYRPSVFSRKTISRISRLRAIAQRSQAFVQQFHWSRIDVKIQFEPQAPEECRRRAGSRGRADRPVRRTGWRRIRRAASRRRPAAERPLRARYLSAPQSNSTNSIFRPVAEVTARSTFTASGVTSLPIPSPGMTAMRAAGPPWRRGVFGTSLTILLGLSPQFGQTTVAQSHPGLRGLWPAGARMLQTVRLRHIVSRHVRLAVRFAR